MRHMEPHDRTKLIEMWNIAYISLKITSSSEPTLIVRYKWLQNIIDVKLPKRREENMKKKKTVFLVAFGQFTE